MPTIILPTSLKGRAAGRDSVDADGSTVGECLRSLESREPNLKGWLLDDRGDIRRHVNVFVGDTKADLGLAVGERDQIYVIQAISGGAANER